MNQELIYLIFCSKCNKDAGVATSNKDVLTNIPYQCHQCGHKSEKADNYQTIEKDKFLEGHEKIEGKD
jgi:hypothetical protein